MSVPQRLLGCVVSFALLLQLAPSRAWTVTPMSCASRLTTKGITTRRKQQLSPLRDNVLMPDGGVSPCVIRVVGVGGGGCNAVRINERERDIVCAGISARRVGFINGNAENYSSSFFDLSRLISPFECHLCFRSNECLTRQSMALNIGA